MTTSEDEHSVRHEPFGEKQPLAGEPVDNEPAHGGPVANETAEQRAHLNVWDEPATKLQGISAPDGALTYEAWYRRGLETTSAVKSWTVMALLGLAGGPLALLGALFSSGAGVVSTVLTVVLVAPVLEEMLKISGVIIALERRPYLFQHSSQLIAAIVISAFIFATIENLLYVNVYTQDPSPAYARWRWSVCTALHVGSSLIAGLGVRRMWHASRRDLSRPRPEIALPYAFGAAVLHGVYNLFAFTVVPFFEPF